MTLKYVINPFTGNFDVVDTADVSGTLDAICKASDSVGDCVKVIDAKVGELYQVEKLDIDNDTKPAIGIIQTKSTTTRCVIRVLGVLKNVYSGLLPGETYMVDTDSQLTRTLGDPATGFRYVQIMGAAVSDDEFMVLPNHQRHKKVPS